jgi:hypothetical protein
MIWAFIFRIGSICSFVISAAFLTLGTIDKATFFLVFAFYSHWWSELEEKRFKEKNP